MTKASKEEKEYWAAKKKREEEEAKRDLLKEASNNKKKKWRTGLAFLLGLGKAYRDKHTITNIQFPPKD